MHYALCGAVLITQHVYYTTPWQYLKQVIMQCKLTKIHAANSDHVKYVWVGIFKKRVRRKLERETWSASPR